MYHAGCTKLASEHTFNILSSHDRASNSHLFLEYLFECRIPRSQLAVNSHCQELGAHLVSVGDAAEGDALIDLVNRHRESKRVTRDRIYERPP